MEPNGPNLVSPIFVGLLGIMSAAVVLTLYHCIVITWCNPRRTNRSLNFPPEGDQAMSSIEISTVQLIPPAHTYGKGEGMVSGSESTCPVCLCDFKDGEAIRLLPECMHYFHVPCIDMWLRSHSNCPMCRAETTPNQYQLYPTGLPVDFGRVPDFGG